MEQRHAARLAASGASSGNGDAESSTPPEIVPHKVKLNQEFTRYVAEGVQPDVDGLSLPGFWLRRSSSMLSQNTGKSVAPADMPRLALIVRLYHGVKATCCQAERNFCALSFLLANLRSTMGGAFKVEQVMFLRLNQELILQRSDQGAAGAPQAMYIGRGFGADGSSRRDGHSEPQLAKL